MKMEASEFVVARRRSVVAAAKAAVAFAKDHDKFVVLGGAMGKTELDLKGVQALATLPGEDRTGRADLAASFQRAVADCLAERTARAARRFRALHPGGSRLVVAGGVAANGEIRAALDGVARAEGLVLALPPPALCTDNGAMVAWAGLERLRLGQWDGLDFAPRPRWPLDPQAPKAAFAGVKA